jgi:predicted dehydrogenase
MNNIIEKIRIGIVGLNFGICIVDDIVNGDAAPFFTVAGVCDLNRERAAHISKKFSVRVIENLDDILAAEDIPVVGLFTAPSGRAKLMERILDAGKDIITTKPFELDAKEAEAVLQKARRLGRKIMLNSPSPLPSPDLRQILEWADIYNLGNIVACRCDTWASYRENADGTWYDSPNLCPVAPIFRLGIYLINDIARLMGKAKTVQVLHSQLLTKRPTPDNAQLGILFESGAIANVFASFCVEDGQYYKNSGTQLRARDDNA